MPPAYLKIIIIICILFSALPLEAGTRSHFLSHGPSCISMGRGDTGVAIYAGPGSAFYNPALLSEAIYGEAELSHFMLYEGSRYSFGSFGFPLAANTHAGFSVINLGSGEVEIRRTLTDTPSTTRTNQWAMLFSLARHFPGLEGLNAGLSLKYLSFDMAGHTGSGAGLDAGAAFDFGGPEIFGETSFIRTGVSLQNLVAPRITMVSEPEKYPLTFNAGGALEIPVNHSFEGKDVMSFFSEVSHADGTPLFHEGIEYSFHERYALRAGCYGPHVTAGAGYRLSRIIIDYAVDLNDLALFHRFSLRYLWQTDRSPSRKKAVRKGSLLYEARQAMAESTIEKTRREKESKPLFKKALMEYRHDNYLHAAVLFGQLIMKYPEIESSHLYYERINTEMSREALSPYEANLEKASYARGYVSYREQRFADALREWEKVLQINPGRIELVDYMKEAHARIKDLERLENEKNALSAASSLYGQGVEAFTAGNYISCIKIMERLQTACGSSTFSQAAEYHSKAKTYIEKSVKELTSAIKKQPARSRRAPQTNETEVDESGSDNKYREGLILYAQGKLSDAERMWEIALRLNENNQKARRALEKVRQEISTKR